MRSVGRGGGSLLLPLNSQRTRQRGTPRLVARYAPCCTFARLLENDPPLIMAPLCDPTRWRAGADSARPRAIRAVRRNNQGRIRGSDLLPAHVREF